MRIIKALLATTPYAHCKIEPASSDASFRRYFRLYDQDTTLILMDASLEKESLAPFIDITNRLRSAHILAPKIFYQDREQGLLILEDFGTTDLLRHLGANNFTTLYKRCIDTIVKMQHIDPTGLPLYDESFLKFEMSLMQEWFLERYLGIELTPSQQEVIKSARVVIAHEVLAQPQGYFVHRDFHSRNIMLTPDDRLGIIDYQDAMNGALTYDLVSLLKDLYIRFEPKEIEALALHFRDLAKLQVNDEQFIQWFDFMGLQRHLKVLGIFARLSIRDGKEGYLKDLPLTLQYVLETTQKYPQTQPLYRLLREVKLP
jgi:aminoglycoside/choline kinase family phosphotransferase